VQIVSIKQQYNVGKCKCSNLEQGVYYESTLQVLPQPEREKIFHKFKVNDILKLLLETETEDKQFCKISVSYI
jgi:hypothetical protein